MMNKEEIPVSQLDGNDMHFEIDPCMECEKSLKGNDSCSCLPTASVHSNSTDASTSVGKSIQDTVGDFQYHFDLENSDLVDVNIEKEIQISASCVTLNQTVQDKDDMETANRRDNMLRSERRCPPPEVESQNITKSHKNLEKINLAADDSFELFGYDLSNCDRINQFFICATGVLAFTLVYGYLQELLSVQILNRQLGIFFAAMQFAGYTFWSYYLKVMHQLKDHDDDEVTESSSCQSGNPEHTMLVNTSSPIQLPQPPLKPPFALYLCLSFLRAIDLGVTNLSMQYLNYPAKTMLKSSRVGFTMVIGIFIGQKKYRGRDYCIVGLLVAGLMIFLHADSKYDSATFHPLGVALLVISLICDGAVSNLSENLMNKYNVGQDEYLFRMYSIAFLFLLVAAHLRNELVTGLQFLTIPGSMAEVEELTTAADGDNLAYTSKFSAMGKIFALLLFVTTGILGSSCAAAITKHFGALTMSITSTARKAMTLFLSFAMFPNKCTPEHAVGIGLFMASLIMKSLRVGKAQEQSNKRGVRQPLSS